MAQFNSYKIIILRPKNFEQYTKNKPTNFGIYASSENLSHDDMLAWSYLLAIIIWSAPSPNETMPFLSSEFVFTVFGSCSVTWKFQNLELLFLLKNFYQFFGLICPIRKMLRIGEKILYYSQLLPKHNPRFGFIMLLVPLIVVKDAYHPSK